MIGVVMKTNGIYHALVMGVALALAACGGAAPSAQPSGGQQSPAASAGADSGADALYQAAKKEGEVVLNAQDPDSEKLAVDAFTKRYPGVKITWETGRGADISRKLQTQAAANKWTHDVFSSGPHDLDGMRQAGLLEPYQSPELASVRQDAVDANKVWDPVYVLVYGITVNTKLVPAGQEPKSWSDLADPKWNGKLSMQDPRGSGGTMTMLVGMSKDQGLGLDYVKKLGNQNMFIGRETQQLLTDLIRGENPILLAASAGQLVTAKEKDPSVPFKQIKPTDGVTAVLLAQALMKNAPHPNAAKLWVDWRLSQEGQTILGQEGQAPVRNGVTTPHEETNMDGVKIMYLDIGQDTAKLNDYTKMWDDIFFKK
jgi:iron(III) transport system substrate-binding protein